MLCSIIKEIILFIMPGIYTPKQFIKHSRTELLITKYINIRILWKIDEWRMVQWVACTRKAYLHLQNIFFVLKKFFVFSNMFTFLYLANKMVSKIAIVIHPWIWGWWILNAIFLVIPVIRFVFGPMRVIKRWSITPYVTLLWQLKMIILILC